MSRLVEDETVVLDLESGMYFGLDGTGKRIWESVSEGHSLREIVSIIVAEYEAKEVEVVVRVLGGWQVQMAICIKI